MVWRNKWQIGAKIVGGFLRNVVGRGGYDSVISRFQKSRDINLDLPFQKKWS